MKHGNDPHHKALILFLCPIPECKNAVTGFRLKKQGMDLHKDLHICKGDIEPNTEYVPQKVGELRVHSDLALYSLILQHDGLARGHGGQENDDRESPEESLDDDDGDFDFGDGDLEGFSSSLVDYEEQERNDLLLNSLEDQNTPIHAIELLSKVTRNRILEQNTTLWSMSYTPSYSS